MNQKKRIALTTTFVGLVCGFVLTQQQAAAAATNAPDSTTTSMLAPENTAAATSAEPTQKEQPVNQQTSTQKAVTSMDTVSETTNQNRILGTQAPATNTSTQSASSSNNITNSAPTQQAAASSVSKTNEATSPISQPTTPKNSKAITNSLNASSLTTDPQTDTIAQGTWGTSKWEYTHQGANYILHFHAGTFGTSRQGYTDNHSHFVGSIGASSEILNCNWQWIKELTQIFIDPGVIANQDSSYLFAGLENLQQIIGLANLDTTKITNMSWMFHECYSLASLDVSHFNTANVTNMSWMFTECYSLASLDVSHFNTANVTDMSWMFKNCSGITSLDVSKFDTTNVTDMSWMFAYCTRLTSLDLSHFNTSKVTNMRDMFNYCMNLTSLDLSNFNTAKVTDMYGMFKDCLELTSLDLSNFNTANVTNTSWMFEDIFRLNHLILGSQIYFKYTDLKSVPNTGTKIPGTNRVVASPYWVATSGYQQGHKYTSDELMNLTVRDQVTTYDWDSKPAFTQTTETKTKDRTIVIHQPDGNTKTEIQSVMISRTITLNADGSKTYGNWSSAQWDGYALPEFAGYTASVSQIPAQTVDGNTEDQTIDVYYAPQEQTVEIQYLSNGQIVGTQKITGYTGDTIMPNYHAPQGYEITSLTPATITIDGTGKQIIQVQVSPKLNDSVEHKTLTRTINLHLPDGTMRFSKQTALLERQVTINAVTGEKIYGAWNTGNWKALNVPTLAGYTASQDQVAAQQVTGADSDQTVDVYYTPTN